MACHIERNAKGEVARIVCTRGVGRERQCIVCHRFESRVAMKLCDYPLHGAKQGQTCSRPICVHHAHHVEPDTDYCPAHARLVEAQGVA
jgi:hypothetical protein